MERMRWVGHVASVGLMSREYKIMHTKAERNWPFTHLSINGR